MQSMTNDEVERRMEEVRTWQKRYNMTPRDDSQLTLQYGSGTLPTHWTADVVARELMATDFLYKNTLYGEVSEDFFRRLGHRIRKTYKISWTSTWVLARFYGTIALKLMCLSACGVRIPQSLPPPEVTKQRRWGDEDSDDDEHFFAERNRDGR